MRSRENERSSSHPIASAPSPAIAPGKQTQAQRGQPPPEEDTEAPGGAPKADDAPKVAEQLDDVDRAGDWQADADLMNALGLPELGSAPSPPDTRAAASPPPARRQRPEKYVPIAVAIDRAMGREEFQELALRQVLGASDIAVRWRSTEERYSPAQSPVPVQFEERLLLRARGQVNAARGIETDERGRVAGAELRAKDLQAQPASDEKSALLAEIDRRYRAATGPVQGADPAASRKTALWRLIRDEVLFQQQHLAALPEPLQRPIRIALQQRDLEPADYEPLFRVAQKLALLPPGAVADFTSKLLGASADLAAFDAAVDAYTGELAEREQAETDRTAVQNKLLGLDEVYRLYRRTLDQSTLEELSPMARPLGSLSGQLGLGGSPAAELRSKLEQQLARHGFASVADFASHIAQLERSFEDGAARISLDVLARYAGKLHQEAQRYQDPAVVKTLHGKLAGLRAQYQQFQAAAQQASEHSQQRTPIDSPRSASTAEPLQRAQAAKASAAASIQALAVEYPIFAEDELPVDQRLDKSKLAQAEESELAGLLQAHLAQRLKPVAEARGQIEAQPALVYKMDKLMPAFYAQLDIHPGSIHDQILQDKQRDEAITRMATGLALTVVTVALTAVSLGAATPALVAAGASLGAAGLSAHLAYAEYQEYAAEHALAGAGLTDDPSTLWLVLAITGAGVDVAAAARAIRALAPAAKALVAGGDLADFTRAVEALQRAQLLDQRIAAAAERAATARSAYAAAKLDLTSALGKAYSFPGPFTDPAVYRSLVKMAVAKLKEGAHSLSAFLDELKQSRLAAKLGDLTPEELLKAKEAWSRAQTLAPLVDDAVLLEKLLTKIHDPAKLERLLRAFPAAELENIVDVLDDAEKIVVMLDHLGPDSTVKLVRRWIEEGDVTKIDDFLDRLNNGVGKELAETSKLGEKSLVVDTNVVVALEKDSNALLKPNMNSGEIARVKYINTLPQGTEMRLGNVTVGETGGAMNLKGVPIDVVRDSPEYRAVLSKLEGGAVGGPKGFADRALVADLFFSSREHGATPRLLTSDSGIVNKLADIMGISPNKAGGFKGLIKRYGTSGFNVTIEGRTITIIPVL
jgi:hypothetical protein